jgi:glycosyltransferase involved in cell wall biosynthesis
MTVAYLFGSLNRGGTETLMLDVFHTVQADRLNIIGIYRKEGVLLPDFISGGKEMIYLPVRSNFMNYVVGLRRLVKQNNIDILHTVQSLDAVLAIMACVGLKVKVVQTIHGFDADGSLRSKWPMKWSLLMTNVTVFVSKYQREYYLQKFKLSNRSNFRVVYNGIAMDKFLPRAQKPESGPLQLLTVGNFNAGRDQLTLCKLALRLKNEGVDFRWFFAGKRIDNEAWRYDRCVQFVRDNQLNDRVIFAGVRNDVPELLSQSDLFVYASDHDTFGIAVVEAMAAGVPVLVNDWPVMKEITNDGEWATIYKTRDENDFYLKFKQALSATSAQDKVKTRFSIQEHINQLIQTVYQPLLNA